MNEVKKILYGHLTSAKAWVIILGYIAAMILAAVLLPQLIDKEALRETLLSGNYFLGTILYILLTAVYIVLVPFYNTPVWIASGFLFGSELGWLVNFTAMTIGLFTIVWLVKKFGRPIAEKLINKQKLEKYDKVVGKIGPMALFVIYVLPATPDDEVTYLIAAAPIAFRRFILPIIFGNIAKATLSYLGDKGAAGIAPMLLSRLIVLIVGGAIIYWQEAYLKRK